MFAKTYGATTLGIDGQIIDVEVDAAFGLPGFELVGLPDTSVKESKERVRTAIRNSGFQLRQERVTVNLAPADVRKDSPGLDLPMAVGLLVAYGLIPAESVEHALFSAELSLDGNCRPVSGVLPMAITARERGLTDFYVAGKNVDEALLIDGLRVYAVENLAQLIRHLTGEETLTPAVPTQTNRSEDPIFADDFADVQGQYQAKRALEIAAAGGHNVLMVGVPGSGKTMLARRMSSILPEMTKEEAIEVTKIYSISGLLGKEAGLVTHRPFRSPHHTSSMVAMIGGGSVPRPGEVTLAHHGVLFLDELPEFSKKTLEVLREPIEDRTITVARANATLSFPSSIILIVAMNPCPCGYYGDKNHGCECSPGEIKRYTRKISGPLLDRIDIHIRVSRVDYSDLHATQRAESSAAIRARVVAAREIERARLREHDLFCNAQMNHSMIKKYCRLQPDAEELLEAAFHRINLSARSHDRIIKVARTIADLAGVQEIAAPHIAEAIQLRSDVGLNIE
ncbi:YifB family Mg chelatase-like AAA ATPase [Selenomonas sp. F0473]|uniref:YifB family Mg chelatase-like AAA ATPase n=1 Tax=Selenomonas sp. F0473 TaxID=999423 RepID=UPI00029EBEE5|nr:YifB family Mg chelatase-like AAA ATPase [Selenomonas sp. F0473]EKU71574.1 Mg chelatase-like protein [Selenomonas sp. F0473]